VLAFYDEHYPRDDGGKLLLKPAQALETWQKAINPLPPIAGLKYDLPRLLALPRDLVGENLRQRWQRLLGEVPDLPRAEAEGEPVLAPAAKVLEGPRNIENPELYAVFPYRLYGVGRPELDLARRTFAHRRIKSDRGWQQDGLQAACLGLGKKAARLLGSRVATKNPHARFPAFWGPNFDWVPDQDHGSHILLTLQTMLLQTVDHRLLVFPAWPRQWDVKFRLWAPGGAVVEGEYRDGQVVKVDVQPEARKKDLEVLAPQ
ncbi:MAG: hypothetical protein J7M26_02180, partial [Armatimonadetes bacterium]|nr:hypothetical protein [Armatimonadota bacterium]